MTTQARWDDAKKLLHVALDLEPEEREAFLQRACANAPDLLAEVRSLLSWVDESEEFLETPAIRVADLVLAPPDGMHPLIGQSLGPTFTAPSATGVTSVISAVSADAVNNRNNERPFATVAIRVQ